MTIRPITLMLVLTLAACTSSGTSATSTSDTPPLSSPDTSTTATPETSTQAETARTEPTETTVTTQSPIDNGASFTCWTSEGQGDQIGEISLTDVTQESGLIEPLVGFYGHAAIWTDVNADGLQDLFVGNFADRDAEVYQHRGAAGASPDRLLIQGSSFEMDQGMEEMFTRTSGGASADLDGDGDLDLVLSRNFRQSVADEALTQLMRNDSGSLSPVDDSGLPAEIGGRSVAIFDFDHDGMLDLFLTEDRWSGGSSVLLENTGDMSFVDATDRAGLPNDVHGLGVAAADLNRDGHPDIFVSGSNRMFIANGDGTFDEAETEVFEWEVFGEEDDVAGVSVADLNRDGWLDLAIGQHYNSTVDFGQRVPVRIYLNRGTNDRGHPRFEDVTDRAGLPGLETKAPHVEINDLDNDGWPDLITSASAGDGSSPALFRHEGLEGDVPRFSSLDELGSAKYWVSSPTADFDRDGRLDVFLLDWQPAHPSILLRNTTEGGNWLQVAVDADHGHGIGWLVEVFDPATDELIGAREITVTQGYSAGVSPIAHFGLGDVGEAKVVLHPPQGAEPITLDGVMSNQHLRYPDGCGS